MKLVFKDVLDMEEIFIFWVSEWRTMTCGIFLVMKLGSVCNMNK